jgi:hypothetical protein
MSLSNAQRQRVRERADNCCEYCRISQAVRLTRFQIDHIIALKHGGLDTDDNLCLACYECNTYKGPNVAALDPVTGHPTKLYHPRQQTWADHFKINPDATISGLSPEGRATVAVLRFNDHERIQQRLSELNAGDYPCETSPS